MANSADKLPIKMLNDRVLVQLGGPEGERRTSGGILIPATAQVGKRLTWGEVVGVGARLDLNEETVYRITKAFWENLPQAVEKAAYMKRVTKEYAVRDGGLPLHPGAARYYREIGLDIPAGSMPRS